MRANHHVRGSVQRRHYGHPKPPASRTLGDDVDRLMNAQSDFSPSHAIPVGKLLSAEGISQLEQSCPYGRLGKPGRSPSTTIGLVASP